MFHGGIKVITAKFLLYGVYLNSLLWAFFKSDLAQVRPHPTSLPLYKSLDSRSLISLPPQTPDVSNHNFFLL